LCLLLWFFEILVLVAYILKALFRVLVCVVSEILMAYVGTPYAYMQPPSKSLCPWIKDNCFILIYNWYPDSYKFKSFYDKKNLFLFCRRFAPNVSEISDEFCRLASEFDNSFLPEYAGQCYLGAAKCEKLIGNEMAEVDILLKV
jgi:hypothetical protein